ncbi:MAG: Imm50 family immunity protein [Bryobacterales bacterium]|nr:Imm50 family immunity protein [Bryobacterales bacterium]
MSRSRGNGRPGPSKTPSPPATPPTSLSGSSGALAGTRREPAPRVPLLQKQSRTIRVEYTETVVSLAEQIPGYAELAVFWGGAFPSFHDSEILSLHLDRTGASHICIRLVGRRPHTGMTEPVAEGDTIVTFLLVAIDDLELHGFSVQNVISELTLSKTESGIRLELWPCYGLAGWLDAEHVRIEFNPDRVT